MFSLSLSELIHLQFSVLYTLSLCSRCSFLSTSFVTLCCRPTPIVADEGRLAPATHARRRVHLGCPWLRQHLAIAAAALSPRLICPCTYASIHSLPRRHLTSPCHINLIASPVDSCRKRALNSIFLFFALQQNLVCAQGATHLEW